MVEARIAGEQGVPVTVYRVLAPADGEGGYQADVWVSTATGRMALAEITDRDRHALGGRETNADFRAVAPVALDVQKGDGIEIGAAAAHHAGRKFKVLASRDPMATYRRLLLEEQPKLKFT